MDDLIKRFNELQEEFEKTLKDYLIFKEMLEEIDEKELPKINSYLKKNDIFYQREANDHLKKLIDYIKKTSLDIDKQYETFEKYVAKWNKISYINASEYDVRMINERVRKANKLIGSHKIEDLHEANKIMNEILKKVKEYNDK